MIEFASSSILFVAFLSLLQFLFPLVFSINKFKSLDFVVSSISIVSFILLSIAFCILIFSYINSDFSLLNVWSNSHTSKPLIYKISGSWGNHEGSMLLWCWVMALYGFFVAINIQKLTSYFKLRILMLSLIHI